jgi:hypothetical protein
MARINKKSALSIIRGIREIRGNVISSINLLIDNNRQRRLNQAWSIAIFYSRLKNCEFWLPPLDIGADMLWFARR